MAAGRVTVFIETNCFREEDRHYVREQAIRLPVATADTGRLIAAELAILSVIWRDGHRYSKAGVMPLVLGKAEGVHGGLSHAPDDDHSRARMKAMDMQNARFGRDTITYPEIGTRRT